MVRKGVEKMRMTYNKKQFFSFVLRTFINSPENLICFKNPLYEPNDSALVPSLYGQSISVWSGLFLRNLRNDKPQKEASAEIEKMVEGNKKVRDKVEKQRRYSVLIDLCFS